jgi:hypothetical protein
MIAPLAGGDRFRYRDGRVVLAAQD